MGREDTEIPIQSSGKDGCLALRQNCCSWEASQGKAALVGFHQRFPAAAGFTARAREARVTPTRGAQPPRPRDMEARCSLADLRDSSLV